MNLDEFCRARGIDLPSVISSVESGVGLSPDDVLIAVGSLAEGIGNSKSDLDLLLITSRPEAVLPAQEEVTVILEGSLVDMRILRLSRVNELLGRLEHWCRLPWDLTHAAGFGIEERTLLHRLCHAYHLWPRQDVRETHSPRVDDVARLKLHTARHVARSVQVDLDGYVEEGEFRALVFAAQDLLGHAVDGLLAGYGFTNPLPKWRIKLLGSLPADWETRLTVRPSGLDAADCVWGLHRVPDHPAGEECVDYALRISSVSRSIFVWAEQRLLSQDATSDVRRLWRGREREGIGRAALPNLDFDVDFLLSEDSVTLGRLNGFGKTLELSAAEFDIALLCDGISSVAEADALALTVSGGGGAISADDVVARLAAANLIRLP